MGKTAIGWSDETWNPATGCDRVSPGCALGVAAEGVAHPVVPLEKASWSPFAIEASKGCAAAALARDDRVPFTGCSEVDADSVVEGVVDAGAAEDFKVLGPVIELVAVDVVDDFAAAQRAAEG